MSSAGARESEAKSASSSGCGGFPCPQRGLLSAEGGYSRAMYVRRDKAPAALSACNAVQFSARILKRSATRRRTLAVPTECAVEPCCHADHLRGTSARQWRGPIRGGLGGRHPLEVLGLRRPARRLRAEVARATHEVERPALHLVVDAADVLADDAHGDQLDPAQQQHHAE